MSNAQGMTENFGAGWTLAMKMDGADTTNFKYDSALWTNDKGLHENSANMQRTGYKHPKVYSMMEFDEILIGMDGMLDGTVRWVKLDVASTSLQDLFANTATNTFLSRPTKEEWIWSMNDPNADIQPHCNANGINIAQGSSRARFGIISNQENNCGSCDSRIGVGGWGHPRNNIVVGNTRHWVHSLFCFSFDCESAQTRTHTITDARREQRRSIFICLHVCKIGWRCHDKQKQLALDQRSST